MKRTPTRHSRLVASGLVLLGLLMAACGSSDPVTALPGAEPLPPGDADEAINNAACLMAPSFDPPPPNPLRNAYFGELHLHTVYSLDATTTRLTPEDAYCFATGFPVPLPPLDASGNSLLPPARIDRPLDFAALTDHAEWLGERQVCEDPSLDPIAFNSPQCVLYRQDPATWPLIGALGVGLFPVLPPINGLLPALPPEPTINPRDPVVCGLDGEQCVEASRGPWEDIQFQAERFNRPGQFTTFHGYEYTLTPLGDNMHRNVIFLSASVPALPVTTHEAVNPPQLWAQLDAVCTGDCAYLAIPHNANLSAGRMFAQPDAVSPDGYDPAERARHEPLIEIFQLKGDSECLQAPNASPDDPLCDFEKLTPGANFLTDELGLPPRPGAGPVERNYVRYGLKQGLVIEQDFGVNPFQYGIVAATDSHMGTPGGVDEISGIEKKGARGVPAGPDRNFGGVTGVWAEENTRDALFAAMQRKETFGTSGPRIKLRFFGGSADSDGLPVDLCARSGDEFVRTGYTAGVPMGSELPPGAQGLRFAVWALADPFARENDRQKPVPLAKIQIVKGWVEREADGRRVTRERVYDIAQNDDPWQVNDTDCGVSGSGASQLCAVWTDPDFNPEQSAFYYPRVVEKPTCRWAAHRCQAAPAELDCSSPPEEWAGCCAIADGSSPRLIQERAWGSPIWFTPQ